MCTTDRNNRPAAAAGPPGDRPAVDRVRARRLRESVKRQVEHPYITGQGLTADSCEPGEDNPSAGAKV